MLFQFLEGYYEINCSVNVLAQLIKLTHRTLIVYVYVLAVKYSVSYVYTHNLSYVVTTVLITTAKYC